MTRWLAVMLVAVTTAAGLAHPASAKSDVAAAIVAGVAGAAVGAALSKNEHKAKRNRKAHFKPAPGVTCFDYQAACYYDDAGFSRSWTKRIYR